MESLMIGAIPAQDDPVWKISSEKVPHLTICYFGEQPDGLDLTRIQEYIQHAINTSLTRFGLSVDRRGVLGDDEADVLFFDKRFAKEITEFRSLLLKNDEINKLYNSVDQYPEWTPHLTLGYPATPAHPDQRDYPGISWVNFDRIALWTGDYEGPEFILPTQDHSLEVAMSDNLDDFMAHFGIKGMHWGVRRSKAELAKSGSTEEDRPSIDPIAAKAAAVKRGASTAMLTNDELNRVINRIDMERKLSGLLADEPKIKPVRAFVKGLLLKEGKHQIERSTRLIVTDNINKALEKHAGIEIPKGKQKKNSN